MMSERPFTNCAGPCGYDTRLLTALCSEDKLSEDCFLLIMSEIPFDTIVQGSTSLWGVTMGGRGILPVMTLQYDRRQKLSLFTPSGNALWFGAGPCYAMSNLV